MHLAKQSAGGLSSCLRVAGDLIHAAAVWSAGGRVRHGRPGRARLWRRRHSRRRRPASCVRGLRLWRRRVAGLSAGACCAFAHVWPVQACAPCTPLSLACGSRARVEYRTGRHQATILAFRSVPSCQSRSRCIHRGCCFAPSKTSSVRVRASCNAIPVRQVAHRSPSRACRWTELKGSMCTMNSG
jgi:hypothetical protein